MYERRPQWIGVKSLNTASAITEFQMIPHAGSTDARFGGYFIHGTYTKPNDSVQKIQNPRRNVISWQLTPIVAATP